MDQKLPKLPYKSNCNSDRANSFTIVLLIVTFLLAYNALIPLKKYNFAYPNVVESSCKINNNLHTKIQKNIGVAEIHMSISQFLTRPNAYLGPIIL